MFPFRAMFPRVAARETLSVVTHSRQGLPDDWYEYGELYCIIPDCDCRRVLVKITAESGRHVATINHAFDPPGPEDPIQEQTFLDPMNPQSELAHASLKLFLTVLDEASPAHLHRHYGVVKAALRDPSHAVHRIIQRALSRDPTLRPDGTIRPDAPCTCGSSRSFQDCCGGAPVH